MKRPTQFELQSAIDERKGRRCVKPTGGLSSDKVPLSGLSSQTRNLFERRKQVHTNESHRPLNCHTQHTPVIEFIKGADGLTMMRMGISLYFDGATETEKRRHRPLFSVLDRPDKPIRHAASSQRAVRQYVVENLAYCLLLSAISNSYQSVKNEDKLY